MVCSLPSVSLSSSAAGCRCWRRRCVCCPTRGWEMGMLSGRRGRAGGSSPSSCSPPSLTFPSYPASSGAPSSGLIPSPSPGNKVTLRALYIFNLFSYLISGLYNNKRSVFVSGQSWRRWWRRDLNQTSWLLLMSALSPRWPKTSPTWRSSADEMLWVHNLAETYRNPKSQRLF